MILKWARDLFQQKTAMNKQESPLEVALWSLLILPLLAIGIMVLGLLLFFGFPIISLLIYIVGVFANPKEKHYV